MTSWSQGGLGVAAVVTDLLRRDVGAGPHREPELLLEQVGKGVVPRQPEIEKHRFAAVAEHHVARFEIQVDDVLGVQRVKRGGDPRADASDLVRGERRLPEPLAQRLALQELHHDVRLLRKVPGGDEAGDVRPGKRRKDHLLDLEADDRRGVVEVGYERDLHRHRFARGLRFPADAPDPGHAALVQSLLEEKAVDDRARGESRGHA
jgi:hypothetical protein